MSYPACRSPCLLQREERGEGIAHENSDMSDVGFGELSVSCYGWRKMFEKYSMSILTREAKKNKHRLRNHYWGVSHILTEMPKARNSQKVYLKCWRMIFLHHNCTGRGWSWRRYSWLLWAVTKSVVGDWHFWWIPVESGKSPTDSKRTKSTQFQVLKLKIIWKCFIWEISYLNEFLL